MFRFVHFWLRQACHRAWRARRSLGVWCFALMCLVVFCTPFLHTCFRAQTSRDSLLTPTPFWAKENSDTFSLERIYKLRPNDRAAQLAYAKYAESLPYAPRRATFNFYNGLLHQYPNDATVVAGWLRRALVNFRDERITATVAEVFYKWSLQQTSEPSLYTSGQLRQAIVLAQKGRTLEPNNSFFDYALLYFLLCDKRDDEALRVLHSASLKSHYDDHTCDDLATALRVREYVRPLLVEEKAWFVSNGGPPPLQQTQIAQFISVLAWRKQQQGDVQSALAIRGDLARFFCLAMRGRISLTSLELRAIQTAWKYDLTPFVSGSTIAQRIFNRASAVTNATDFAQFATSHGRPDLARETSQILRVVTASRAALKSHAGNLPFRVLIYTLLGIGCLLAIPLFLALYVALALFLPLSKPVEVTRRDVWTMTPVLAFIALAGVLLLLGSVRLPNPTGHFLLDMISVASNNPFRLMFGAILFFAAPTLLNALWCAVSSWRRAQQSAPGALVSSKGLSLLRKAYFFVWGSGLLYAITYSLASLLLAWQGASAWKLRVPGLGELGFTDPWLNLPLIWLVVAQLSLWGWFFYASTLSSPRTHTIYALRRFRQTLLALVPIYSALWILIALLSLPQRRLAETQLNDLLRHGEVYVAQHPDKYR